MSGAFIHDKRSRVRYEGMNRSFSLLPVVAALLVLTGLCPALVSAADEAAVSTSELESLVATIEDEGKRQELVQQLRALIEVERKTTEETQPGQISSVGAATLAAISQKVQAVSASLILTANSILEIPRVFDEIQTEFADPDTRERWGRLLWKVALVLFLGVVAERLVRRALRKPREGLESTERSGFWSRIAAQLGRLLVDLASIAAFALVAYGVLSLLDARPTTRLVALTLINASVIARAVTALARMLLSPDAAGLRIVRAADETAYYWMIWARRIINLTVYGYFVTEAALVIGLSEGLHGLLLNLLGLTITALLLVLVQQNRQPVAHLIRGPDGQAGLSALRRRLGDVWHVLAAVYLVAVYAVWASEVPGGFILIFRASLLTIVILVLANTLLAVLRRLIDRAFAVGQDLKERFPMLEARVNRYVPVFHRTASAGITIVAVVAIFQAWSFDVWSWLTSDTGQALTGPAIKIVLILLVAGIVWEVLSAIIEHYVHKTEGGAGSARMQTLLPLARKALFVVICVMVTLTVLSELGVDIAPLLAGAGVIGLAVGFGAQTLVKDIITGVFILLEDSIAVGDFIDAGGHAGTVESMSIRTIRMRDAEGNVHTVPFSSVETVKNYTKEFAYSLLDIGVAYRENVDEVMEVMRSIGEEMQQDPQLAKDMQQGIEILGVQSLGDSAVVIRARIKTTPGMQWAMRRAYFRRVKIRFDELGIEIPFPHQTIYFGVDKAGNAPAAPIRLQGGAPLPSAPADADGA